MYAFRVEKVYMIPTRDHDEILNWAQRYGATPAQIHPLKFDGQPAILYFLIGNVSGTADLHPITWDSFFAQFDLLELSFAYDDSSPRFSIVRIMPNKPNVVQN